MATRKRGRFRRVTVADMWTRFTGVKHVQNKDVHHNGDNNAYPTEIEEVINNSPTAKLGARTKEKFLIGQGFLSDVIENDTIVNARKNITLYQFGRSAAASYARQGGVWIHRTFKISKNGDFVTADVEVLDYKKPRKSKVDDNDKEGKIYVCDWTDKDYFGSKKVDEYYPFTTDQNAIREQLKRDAGIKHNNPLTVDEIAEMLKKQKGQISFINPTPEYVYPLAPIDPAFNDADSEARISESINNDIRHNFANRKLVISNNLSTDEEKRVNDALNGLLGLDSTAGYAHIVLEDIQVELKDYLHIIDIKTGFEDKMFEKTKEAIVQNILACYDTSKDFVLASDAAVFGNSGESYKQMKAVYNQKTQDDRKLLEQGLGMVLGIKDLEIVPLEDVINESDVKVKEDKQEQNEA